jgi:hypothetical protein
LVATVLTFLSEKIVAVVITTVVVVAAVPTFVLAINGNTITITTGTVASSTRHGDDEERARVVVEVKSAGDAVIVKLNNEDAGCASQIEQLAAVSKLSGSATQSAIARGKNEFHASVQPFINEIKADEDEVQHLSVITTETEQTFLVRINTVQVIALGEGGSQGALITVCQTIIVEIRQIVVVVTTSGGERDNDNKQANP